MKTINNLNTYGKDVLKPKKKAKAVKVYVDGETLEPIIKKKKSVLNPNISRRKVIHLHPEVHNLDDPDYRIIATNDVDEMFKMEDFDADSDQHFVCTPSAAVNDKEKQLDTDKFSKIVSTDQGDFRVTSSASVEALEDWIGLDDQRLKEIVTNLNFE